MNNDSSSKMHDTTVSCDAPDCGSRTWAEIDSGRERVWNGDLVSFKARTAANELEKIVVPGPEAAR